MESEDTEALVIVYYVLCAQNVKTTLLSHESCQPQLLLCCLSICYLAHALRRFNGEER